MSSEQIPCECQNLECGFQYCAWCVQVAQRINGAHELIRCMYCGHTSKEGPKQNQFLLDLLWEQYRVKYGVESIPVSSIMPGTLLNDIGCRATHLKSLVQTLKRKINRKIAMPEPMHAEIERANILIRQLDSIQDKVYKHTSMNMLDN